MRHCVGVYKSLDMLQPPCGVRDLLLLPAIQNHNQAVHIQRDVTLDHSRACVETKGGVPRVEGGSTNQFDGTVSLMVVRGFYFTVT